MPCGQEGSRSASQPGQLAMVLESIVHGSAWEFQFSVFIDRFEAMVSGHNAAMRKWSGREKGKKERREKGRRPLRCGMQLPPKPSSDA